MIRRLTELVREYGTKYRVAELVRDGALYKLEKGMYSDRPDVPEVEVLLAKFPAMVLTLNSAYHYYALSDELPDAYYLATERRSRRVADPRVVQFFVPCGTGMLGCVETELLGDRVRIYDRERLLIETMRYRSKLPYDLYREVVDGFRNVRNELYGAKIDDYLRMFPRRAALTEAIRKEVY